MNSHRSSALRIAALVVLTLLVLSGCARSARTPSPTPLTVAVPPFSTEQTPPEEAVAQVEAAKGGMIALQGGAQATLPPQGLTQDTKVSFRTMEQPPVAPVPSSIVGRAYELSLEDSELAGIAQLRLPLPAGVTADQYEVAPYLWTGRLWERVNARDVTGGIEFGVNSPGIYALLGHWKLADSSLALIKPDTIPGEQSIPLTVVGQYRYSATPALQDGLVPARLVLKQDSSGGAGLVTGDPSLDKTVDEATLYFKPDPAQSQGLIEFSHVFDLAPGALDLDPGVTTRFYATLLVEDAAAPTRRISSGVEYTQNLPIQIHNMEVVRPVVLQEDRVRLRWKIMLNGLTFQTPEARSPTLALQPVVDQGGVGDYSIVLEVEKDGAWVPISNELSVQLAMRATPTLPPGATPNPTPEVVAITTPDAIPTPAVPTRRPTPVGGGNVARVSATPVVTATNTPTMTPTRPPGADIFWADKYALASGECTNLHWKVDSVISVLFNEQAATGNETRQICPTETTNYTLKVTSTEGVQTYPLTVQVTPAGQPAILFTADQTQIAPGGCVNLSWSATDVREVRLNGQGVAGVATQQQCLSQTTDFDLTVITNSDETITKRLTIIVVQPSADAVDAAFWADQYTLPSGGCTTLHWRVLNVQSVFLDGQGVSGEGTQQACPDAQTQVYQLEINTQSGNPVMRDVELTTGDPALDANEVIVQGLVNGVARQNDVSPNEAGDQSGYTVAIDGIRILYAGANGFNQGNVTLGISQNLINLGDSANMDWPVRPGQQIEFRAVCDGTNCSLDAAPNGYLYWRSP